MLNYFLLIPLATHFKTKLSLYFIRHFLLFPTFKVLTNNIGKGFPVTHSISSNKAFKSDTLLLVITTLLCYQVWQKSSCNPGLLKINHQFLKVGTIAPIWFLNST
jgi:hypothetical protein